MLNKKKEKSVKWEWEKGKEYGSRSKTTLWRKKAKFMDGEVKKRQRKWKIFPKLSRCWIKKYEMCGKWEKEKAKNVDGEVGHHSRGKCSCKWRLQGC